MLERITNYVTPPLECPKCMSYVFVGFALMAVPIEVCRGVLPPGGLSGRFPYIFAPFTVQVRRHLLCPCGPVDKDVCSFHCPQKVPPSRDATCT